MFRQAIKKTINEIVALGGTRDSIIYLRGENIRLYSMTDGEYPHIQFSSILYLTNVRHEEVSFIIDAKTEKVSMFVPKLPESYATWFGHIKSLKEWKTESSMDQVFHLTEMSSFISKLAPEMTCYTNSFDWINHKDHANIKPEGAPDSWNFNTELLEQGMKLARSIKTQDEINEMRKINKISSDAHAELWKCVKPGMTEAHLDATFRYHTFYNSYSEHQAYPCICATGSNGAVLHYFGGTSIIKDGDMILIDAGAKSLSGYASDITRCFPANGKFSDDQKMIYNIVLAAQLACINKLKPGVHWKDIHMTSVRTITEGLVSIGMIKGDVDELITKGITALFYPHGVGHLIGLDVHDVNSRLPLTEEDAKLKDYLQYLRYRRPLKAGNVVTVEPGIYFIPYVITPALTDTERNKYLNVEMITRFLSFGGVRIEDDIVITETGYDNLTTAPKTVEEIESIMAASSSSLGTTSTHS